MSLILSSPSERDSRQKNELFHNRLNLLLISVQGCPATAPGEF